jgi:tRNA (adenine37-N6)-methyltransferase
MKRSLFYSNREKLYNEEKRKERMIILKEITILPIGYVRTTRSEIKDDDWGENISKIELDESQFSEEVLYGLEDYSHLEVIFHFHKVDPSKIEKGARHPRNNHNWPKVGIFSQRGKNRPNLLGASICKILKVEGLTITVQALDAIDSTPVIDIKPYIQEFVPAEKTSQPQWATELMKNYY